MVSRRPLRQPSPQPSLVGRGGQTPVNELARGQDALREETNARFSETNARFSETNARFSEMNTRFNIMLVLIGGVWATMVGGFIALFTRL